MIQDLEEKKLYNQYEPQIAESGDSVFCFDRDRLLVKREETGGLRLPLVNEVGEEDLCYLFRIEEDRFFLLSGKKELPGFQWMPVRDLRYRQWKELAFAAATAYHLYRWYADNRFCGRCGAETEHDSRERMLRCPVCGNMIYPRIAPAVIVAVTDGDRLLMTKYNGRAYRKYALIAGFTEIGETAEETVKREVMEETGLHVKDIVYYKSQPWGVDSNLLMGFFCQVDGEKTITIDEEELSAAGWFSREEIPEDDGFSLTREMMRVFKEGGIHHV